MAVWPGKDTGVKVSSEALTNKWQRRQLFYEWKIGNLVGGIISLMGERWMFSSQTDSEVVLGGHPGRDVQ